MRSQTINGIETHKIFAIIRGISPENILPTMEALYQGGIRLVEMTFDRNSEDDTTLIGLQILAEQFRDKLIFGAGTVTTQEQVRKVKELGGQFIVSPDVNPAVIQKTRELEMVSLPGVMTPTEAIQAHNSGADFIKLFPGGLLGPEYIQALCAPLSDLKFIAVGGINTSNLARFAQAGAIGFGIGSNLVNHALVEQKKFDQIYQNACDYTQVIHSLN